MSVKLLHSPKVGVSRAQLFTQCSKLEARGPTWETSPAVIKCNSLKIATTGECTNSICIFFWLTHEYHYRNTICYASTRCTNLTPVPITGLTKIQSVWKVQMCDCIRASLTHALTSGKRKCRRTCGGAFYTTRWITMLCKKAGRLFGVRQICKRIKNQKRLESTSAVNRPQVFMTAPACVLLR